MIGVIVVDALPTFRQRDRLLANNSIDLQLFGDRFEARPVVAWVLEAFVALCRELQPVWGAVCDVNEWDARVMSHENGLSAIGVDFGRFLPGLFAWNYFGTRYRDAIGRRQLLDVPAMDVRELGDGALIRIVDDPRRWQDALAILQHDGAIGAIGPEYFFSIAEPDRPTLAPSWSNENRSRSENQQE